MPNDYKYYPALSDRITIDDLPDFLSFIKEQIQAVFNNIYYKNYCASKNIIGSSAFYRMDIISKTRLEQEIFGTGMTLVLNPDDTDNTVSSFPITIFWQWEILRYVRNFNISTFSEASDAFFDLAIDILRFSKEDILAIAAHTFVMPSTEPSPFKQLVADINALYNSNIDIDEEDEDHYERLAKEIEALNQNVFRTVFTLYLLSGNPSETGQNLKNFFNPFFAKDFEEYIKNLFIPKISTSLNNITLALSFPRTWLKPINPSTNQPYEDESIKSMLRFNVGSLRYSTENGLEFENESSFSFTKSEIGNTGLTLSFDRMKLDLSRTSNIPEAAAAGYPPDFVGVFVQTAEIGLPKEWIKQQEGSTLGIFGHNLLIGTGGISGTLGLRAINAITNAPTDDPIPQDAELEFKLGGDNGFAIGFKHFDLTLRQGAFISTNIKGSLTIPSFQDANGNSAKIEISLSFDQNGNFYITACEADGIPLTIPGVLTYTIKTLTIGREDGKFYLSTCGTLDFAETAIGKVFKDPLEIDRLIIWQDGTIEMKGLDGAFKLSQPKTMQLGPATITVTAIHSGTDERMHNNIMRKYWYVGFDGGLSLNPGGIDARGDGIKIYFTVDNSSTRPLHVFYRLQSICIDLIIPSTASRNKAAALINGYLSIKEPSAGNIDSEYTGGVSVSLPELRLSASAGMRYNPAVPSYLVDVSLDLPAAIPLGPTGMGIYGFRGLLGHRYVATPRAVGLPSNSWFEYYKKKVPSEYREGIFANKMSNEDGFSAGAGMSLATAFDGGKVFSSKVFVMLSLPGRLYIEGKGAILRSRIGLDTTSDPPFFAIITISDRSVEATFGANINIPDGGQIAKVNAAAEIAFFFNSAGAWYLNIGRNQPANRRVRAKIFNLFDAYFYFMLSKQGIDAGAGANWNFNKKVGPVRVQAGAFLDTAGKISFKPVQIGGSIVLEGHAGLSVFGVGFGINLKAWLGAEAPKPFIISGGFQFSLKLFWPIGRIGPFKLEFTWSINRSRDLSEIPLLIDPDYLINPNYPACPVKAINRLTGEAFPVCYSPDDNNNIPTNIDSFIIPVDSFIDVEFLRGMRLLGATGTKFGILGQGSGFTEFVPPRKGKSAQVKHEFHLENIAISYHHGSGWKNYDMYAAIQPKPSDPNSLTEFLTGTENLKYGSWQCHTPNKYNKLRIMSQSPLSYLTDFTSGPPSPPEDFGYREGFLFCEGQQRRKTCVIFPAVGQVFRAGAFTERQRILIRVTGNNGTVHPFTNPFDLQNALSFSGKVELFFPEPQALVKLRLSSHAGKVIVKFFRREEIEETESVIPLSEYIQIETAEETFIPSAPGDFHTTNYKHTEHNNYEVNKISIESIGNASAGNNGFLLNENSGYLLQENKWKLLLEKNDAFRSETQLFSICMMNITDWNWNLNMPTQQEVDENNYAMRDAFTTTINPVWRPDTVYRIKITTNDFLPNESNVPSSYGYPYKRDHYFLFKTAGPLGHFHQYNPVYQELLSKNMEDQFRLSTLKPYIDYSRSYPNADGRLINAKPLFYEEPKLLVFYKQNTVYAMFNNFDEYENKGEITSELRVWIKDPAEPLSTDHDDPTQAHTSVNNWMRNPEPVISTEVRMINNLTWGMNCSKFMAMTPLAVVQEIATGGLKPDKLYTAVFNAVYKAPGDNQEDITQVHSYVFKTSQYKDFAQQVQSYILLQDEYGNKEKEAVFNIEKDFDPAAIDNASALLNGTFDSLMSEYANEFDRLTDGILQLGFLPPAVTTDFNIIKNCCTGKNIGIIVRSPEPFNDPKIPEEELAGTIELAVDSSPASDYIVFFSQDKTQAFISNTELDIPPGTATVTFRYKQFGIHKVLEDAQTQEEEEEEKEEKYKVAYEVLETVTVSFDV